MQDDPKWEIAFWVVAALVVGLFVWGYSHATSGIGVSVREYREIEAGNRTPGPDTYERISELYGWPQTFIGT